MTGSNPFRNVQILHLYDGGHHHAYQWVLDPVFKDEAPFNFTVEVSETPDFSQLVSSIDAGDSFFVVDDHKILQVNTPSWYTRVKLQTGSGKTYYSESLYHFASEETSHKFNIARDIVRREFVRFNYTGHAGWIIKRKNYGEVAKSYVDPISGVPIAASPFEVSTGLVGGYHKPLKIKYSEEGGATRTAMMEDGSGVSSTEVLKVRMVGFPIVAPKDILVSPHNGRFVIGDDVAYITFPGTHIIIVQTFVAKLLPFNDPIYHVKVS